MALMQKELRLFIKEQQYKNTPVNCRVLSCAGFSSKQIFMSGIICFVRIFD
jgi:hypothetical protein